jgi:hypothetical protein
MRTMGFAWRRMRALQIKLDHRINNRACENYRGKRMGGCALNDFACC